MLKLKSEIESKSINIFLQVVAMVSFSVILQLKELPMNLLLKQVLRLIREKFLFLRKLIQLGIFTAIVDLGKNVQATIEMNVLEK